MAATTVYLSDVEISLILESIDMLEHDYEDNHPEQEKLEKIKE